MVVGLRVGETVAPSTVGPIVGVFVRNVGDIEGASVPRDGLRVGFLEGLGVVGALVGLCV